MDTTRQSLSHCSDWLLLGDHSDRQDRNNQMETRLNSWNITHESCKSKCIIPTKTFVSTYQQLITKECHLFLIKLGLLLFGCHDNHENVEIVIPVYTLLCKKFQNFSVPSNGDMTDCFFLHYEIINYDVMNSTVLHFWQERWNLGSLLW